MKRWAAVGVPVLILAGLIGWRVKMKADAEAALTGGHGPRTAIVSVTPVRAQDVVQTYESIGNVESPLNVKLAPNVTGRIEFLQVREGDPVKQGQVLVRIDASEVEADVRQARANVAEAESRLAQARITQAPANVSVSSEIRQQEAALSTAKADLQQAQQDYNAQIAAANAAVADAQGKIAAADAAIGNAQAGIRNAQANLSNAQARYDRINGLYKQGFTAAQDVDDARTAVQVQQGAVDVAKGQLNAAQAQRDSAVAQKKAAEQQARIAKNKGNADIAAAKARVKQAQAALDTARANTAQTPAYAQNLAALEASVDVARAGLKNAEAQLANTVLRAPMDGYVTARYADPGSIASSSQPVLAIQAIRQVYVTFPAPEDVAHTIQPGTPATVRFDAVPGKSYVAKVAAVNPAADPESRQFTVRLAMDNAAGQIKPGMFARVSMVTSRVKDALVVPREAVDETETGATVTVVGPNDVAETRIVALGPRDANVVAVKHGLRAGERVVTLSANPVKDGDTVKVAGSEKQAARAASPEG
jgi:RND family efflux transporter MFP subunit